MKRTLGVLLLAVWALASESCNYYKTVEVKLLLGNEVEQLASPLRPKIWNLLSDVEGITGLWVNPVEYSTVRLELMNYQGRVLGRTTIVSPPCHYYVWSVRDPIIIAHELGHVFGLEHHQYAGNVMADGGLTGPLMTDWQRKAFEQGAKRIERLCFDSGDFTPRSAEALEPVCELHAQTLKTVVGMSVE